MEATWHRSTWTIKLDCNEEMPPPNKTKKSTVKAIESADIRSTWMYCSTRIIQTNCSTGIGIGTDVSNDSMNTATEAPSDAPSTTTTTDHKTQPNKTRDHKTEPNSLEFESIQFDIFKKIKKDDNILLYQVVSNQHTEKWNAIMRGPFLLVL